MDSLRDSVQVRLPCARNNRRRPTSARLRGGPPGRWWDNPEMAKKLGMTGDQVKKMDDIFQQVRIKLIDLNGNLRKEEAMLDPLMQADNPDDAKLLPQIDRVANARAELEKANARLLLSIRHVLTSINGRSCNRKICGRRGGIIAAIRRRTQSQI